jgi:SAM-dependent methyltransferase
VTKQGDVYMKAVTNWDRYYKRIKISQITLGIIWRAYADLLRGVHFQEPIKIIELGCGTAYNTLQISKLFPVDKVTLVDFNPNVLNVARKKLSGLKCEKEFLLQDLLSLDLSEKYNIVHSQGLLEHYTPEQQRKLIRLHKDLLTADGVVVILVPTPSLAYRFWRGTYERLHLWIYSDETALSEAEFTAGLESSGLQILKMKKYHLMELGAICRRGAE